MRTLAYTAATRMALSADTRMPLELRIVTGSNQKSPPDERSSLEAIQRERKLNIPIRHDGLGRVDRVNAHGRSAFERSRRSWCPGRGA
jgi:hypothetical protein